jgi:hypothetical protein
MFLLPPTLIINGGKPHILTDTTTEVYQSPLEYILRDQLTSQSRQVQVHQ